MGGDMLGLMCVCIFHIMCLYVSVYINAFYVNLIISAYLVINCLFMWKSF